MQETQRFSAKFRLGENGRQIAGTVVLDGRDSEVILEDEERIEFPRQATDVFGYSNEAKHVSLLRCLVVRSNETIGTHPHSRCTISPNFILTGKEWVGSDDEKVRSIIFSIDDGLLLFYDFDAFGRINDARAILPALMEAETKRRKEDYPDYEPRRKGSLGEFPLLYYYTDERDIIATCLNDGVVKARHSPTISAASPAGFSVKNKIVIEIEFGSPRSFMEAIRKTNDLLDFFNLVIGRRQNIFDMGVRLETDDGRPCILKVHWMFAPQERKKQRSDDRLPHPSEILLDPIGDPSAYSTVLGNWFARHDDWLSSRQGFLHHFAASPFSFDRLVNAANMFDHMPDSGVPACTKLSTEMEQAKASACQSFRVLPDSAERQSILSALGRLGRPSMKNRAKHRATIISQRVPKLQGLEDVVSQAVDCRNYFVHSGTKKFDYERKMGSTYFLYETLEFVLGASDLFECGWDINRWASQCVDWGHPFARYIFTFDKRKEALEKLMRV